MKFSALNVGFSSPSSNPLHLTRPVHVSVREWYPLKVVIIPLLACLTWKQNFADRHKHATYQNKH